MYPGRSGKKREDEERSRRMLEEKAKEDEERLKTVAERWDALFSVSGEMLDGGACMIKIARGPFHLSEFIDLHKGKYGNGRVPFFKEMKDPAILSMSFFSRGRFRELKWAQFKKVLGQVALLFPKWRPRNMRVVIRADRDLTNEEGWEKFRSSIGMAKAGFFVSSRGSARFLVSKDRDANHHMMLIDLCETGLDLTFFVEYLDLEAIGVYVDGFLSFFEGRNTPKRNFGVAFAVSEFPLSS